jgi:hypothetical protein
VRDFIPKGKRTLVIWAFNRGKAVAYGAVAYFLDHRVSARVAKFTYGTRCAVEFNRDNPQHMMRASLAIPRPSGRRVLPNAFSVILEKVMNYCHMLCRGHTNIHFAGYGRIRDERVPQGVHYGSCRPVGMQYDCHGDRVLQGQQF